MEYLAHVRKEGEVQPLLVHLFEVSKLSKEFASKIGLGEYGELIGLLHDLGKYSDLFQAYIRSSEGFNNQDNDDIESINYKDLKGKIDHSTSGAQWIFQNYLSNNQEGELIGQILSLCIVSHHSGLMNCLSHDGEDIFHKRISKPQSKTFYNEIITKVDVQIFERAVEIITNPKFIELLKNKLIEVHNKNEKSKKTTFFKQGLLIRFLFSCLIDADRLDTINFEKPNSISLKNRNKYKSWEDLIQRLENRLLKFSIKNNIDKIRKDVSDKCKAFSENSKGIYYLTVPTGGGKTLASLRFAVHHANKHKMERIFYVVPFTSIIDQNAEEIKSILEEKDESGNYLSEVILEHHSNLTPDEESWKQKLLSENWDAQIVFISSVQLLESLFNSGTRSARRMHQLANSIIIFDEIQTLPIRCIHIFNNAINFLVKNCGSTVIMSTATQPILHKVNSQFGALQVTPDSEIITNTKDLFKELKRVEVIDKQKNGGWSNQEISEFIIINLTEQINMQESSSTLIIVNTKKSARDIFKLIPNSDNYKKFHLSTSMCPEHRMTVLKEILERVNRNKPVICISTQLIEAGVDVDFGSVIRFHAGLDSIAQAAGRCNRNGRRKIGFTYILNSNEENVNQLIDIKIGQEKYNRVLSEYKEDPKFFDNSLLSTKAIEKYFDYYYFERSEEMKYLINSDSEIDRNDSLIELLSENYHSCEEYKRIHNEFPNIYFRQSFMTAGNIFQAIDSSTQGVIVPYNNGQEIIKKLYEIEEPEKQYGLLKKAQRYSVNIHTNQMRALIKMGAIYEVQKETGIYALLDEYYSKEFGLDPNIINQQTCCIIF